MGWYVLETNAQATQGVQDRITSLGPPSISFRMRRITRSHKRGANPFIPLFPGYLFVQLALPDDRSLVGMIKRYEGVRSWLGMRTSHEVPLAVRPTDIERLQALSEDLCQEVDLSNEKPKPLPKDTIVRVLWGDIPGLVGKVEFDNGVRADILLATAGVVSKISLPRELIQAAE